MISVSVAPALNYSSFLFVSCIWTNLYCLWKQASWTCHLQTQAIESELECGLQIAVCGWRGAKVTYPVFPPWISWSPQPQHSCICHTCLCFQNPKRNSSKWSSIWTAAKLRAPSFTSSHRFSAAAKAIFLLALVPTQASAPTQPVNMPLNHIRHRHKPKTVGKEGSDDDGSNEYETEKMKETSVLATTQLLKTHFTTQLHEVITSN